MSDKIGVLVIHGMGSQGPGYSHNLVEELKSRVKGDSPRFVFQEIYWADVLEERERKLLTWMKSGKEPGGSTIDLDWMKSRRFVIHNFGDALAYHRGAESDKNAYSAIHDVVDAAVRQLDARLDDSSAPVMVLAHSLGAQIMSDYIWDQHERRPKPKRKRAPIPALVSMITFGCNIPLFSLAYREAKPITVPGTKIRKQALKDASRWLNFLDADDVLGWPLKPLYQMNSSKLNKKQLDTLEKIEDYEINVGGFLTVWNPAAHGKYWTDDDMTKPIAEHMRKLVRAL